MSNILIIGYGTVGRNLEKEISDLKPDIVDKYKEGVTTMRDINYDIGFICVDTPLKTKNTNDVFPPTGNFLSAEEYYDSVQCLGMVDIKEVEKAIKEYDCDIYCIKSTCPVGTVDRLKEKTKKKIVFSPEYYGGTHHCNNYKFDFTIIGGDKNDCDKVVQAIIPCYDGRHSFRIVDSKTAEMVKFMENSWIATKVSFCQAFYEMCQDCNIMYDELRELFVLDPRVNPSHTFVYKDHPYWDSHCLNKDVPSIANQFDSEFLKNIIKFNVKQKCKYCPSYMNNSEFNGGILNE